MDRYGLTRLIWADKIKIGLGQNRQMWVHEIEGVVRLLEMDRKG